MAEASSRARLVSSEQSAPSQSLTNISAADAAQEAKKAQWLLKTKARMDKIRYKVNPPRWSVQWWKNHFRDEGPILQAIRKFVSRVFWRVWNAYFAKNYWIKISTSPDAARAEIAALKYLRTHTSIPVPRAYFSCPVRRRAWIFMDRIDGVLLDEVLVQSTVEERDSYIRQISAMLADLRTLKSPYGSKICSASGSHVMVRGLGMSRPLGPFPSERAFNKASMRLPPNVELPDSMDPVVFTHGDFAPYNIMVKDGKIAAIIDWETAGWLPASWEYIQTHHSNWEGWGFESRDIFRSYIPQMMPSYHRELEANRAYYVL